MKISVSTITNHRTSHVEDSDAPAKVRYTLNKSASKINKPTAQTHHK